MPFSINNKKLTRSFCLKRERERMKEKKRVRHGIPSNCSIHAVLSILPFYLPLDVEWTI